MVPVHNKVEWVDEGVKIPFDLKVGEETPLGMFLSPAPKEGERIYRLEVEPDHGRSGLIGRVIFEDEEGRLYRDVDVKGMGYVSFLEDGKPPIVDKVSITSAIRGRAEGIQPIGKALYDLRRTKLFLDLGIRTQRVLALIRLKEITEIATPTIICKMRFFMCYGFNLFTSLGRYVASRTFGKSKIFITNLPGPMPAPPCGGQPYRKKFI